jgi:cytidylate kinase
MSIKIPDKYIEKEIAKYSSAINQQKIKSDDKPKKKIITISRKIGCGGRRIAEKLQKKLGFTLWDREILDVLSNQSHWGYKARMFEALDEKTQNSIEALTCQIFGGIDKHTYMYHLPMAIFVIAQNDAIILGRGAHLLLPDSFRVHIMASFETRLKNIMTYEELDEIKAKQKIIDIDKSRDAFIREVADKAGIKDYMNSFDLEINTDRLDTDKAASIILHGFKLYNNNK